MRKEWMVVLAAGLLLAGLPVWAHHAFAAEFDGNKPLVLKGKLAKMEWINPHSWMHIDVVNPDGSTTRWMVEGGSPNTLFRLGFTKDALPNGVEIIVDGYQAKDGSNRAVGKDLTFAATGKRLFMGGSAGSPDAPGNKQ
jgi:hypothetical protein